MHLVGFIIRNLRMHVTSHQQSFCKGLYRRHYSAVYNFSRVDVMQLESKYLEVYTVIKTGVLCDCLGTHRIVAHSYGTRPCTTTFVERI